METMPEKGAAAEKSEKAEKADKGERVEKANGKTPSLPPPPSIPVALEDLVQTGERPSLPPLPAAGPWRSYKELVSGIASRIVDGQRPLRVLQTIRWDNAVEEAFVKSKYKEMPKVD